MTGAASVVGRIIVKNGRAATAIRTAIGNGYRRKDAMWAGHSNKALNPNLALVRLSATPPIAGAQCPLPGAQN